MGLIKEPKHVDFSMKSEPWTEAELKELSELISKSKTANILQAKRKAKKVKTSGKPENS